MSVFPQPGSGMGGGAGGTPEIIIFWTESWLYHFKIHEYVNLSLEGAPWVSVFWAVSL